MFSLEAQTGKNSERNLFGKSPRELDTYDCAGLTNSMDNEGSWPSPVIVNHGIR